MTTTKLDAKGKPFALRTPEPQQCVRCNKQFTLEFIEQSEFRPSLGRVAYWNATIHSLGQLCGRCNEGNNQ